MVTKMEMESCSDDSQPEPPVIVDKKATKNARGRAKKMTKKTYQVKILFFCKNIDILT